ncbi:HamA C-terminal domain-containing protein [Microbacterium terrisoli]|uniref:HamA C-terminal domain-containing protein n=1 Tax=Microbacterium terrisoli TaxID=3242192 RepID=UPI002805575A|nr:DUF1837 domain-containing protein [Microbacterium protaetiae]
MSSPVLRVRYQIADHVPGITVVCPGYEQTAWRGEDLASDLLQRHLASFALSYTEYAAIDGDTAGRSLSRAARIVYNTDKYQRRGEFGELILHAIARDFFGAQPAVSKIYYKDSANDTVKGFDSVHIVEIEGEVSLWLGESKYYSDLTRAIRDVTAELTLHFESGFLKREFIAITNKLDPNWPHTATVAQLLDSANSLDEIIDSIVVPVLVTYESPTVNGHDVVDEEYLRGLREEADDALKRFGEQLNLPVRLTIQLVLLPLNDKAALTEIFHRKLKAWQEV